MSKTTKPTFQAPTSENAAPQSLQDLLDLCLNKADAGRALATLFMDMADAADGTGGGTVTLNAQGLAEVMGRLAADFDFLKHAVGENYKAILAGRQPVEVS